MKDGTPKMIYLKDYQKPDYLIPEIHLTFELHSSATRVKSRMTIVKNHVGQSRPLVLNGEELKFISIKLEVQGILKDISKENIELLEETLVVHGLGDKTIIEIENEINPEMNKALDGLYKSGNIFCTQNEPEGFRRITYYIDRPDVMAMFTTKIIADKKDYPVLLSNGNLIESGDLDGGKHFALWQDPFPKPCYLYALVAGNLGCVKDTFTTMTGRKIDLRIYVDPGNEDKCQHAMASLKNSMKWDEERFGLEYDLDIFMIVAVDAFNMGAMENKGLNIFNSAYILADPKTATDQNFMGIEGVVGHEYFHNYTGNRITCRDWFQLTLKEGLTVYRDQEFSSDMNDRAVVRIENVNRLRASQFVEDAGPTAHPIKPESYMEINNFYTATIYEKGAEVIRMIATFLGRDGFRRGMDKYFELFDGQAVTTEDFIHAMSVANKNDNGDDFDFTQFKRWYSQAGTPTLKILDSYDEKEQTYTLKITQVLPSTPGQASKEAFHLPFCMGLVDKTDQGKHQEWQVTPDASESTGRLISKGILEIKNMEETFVFKNICTPPILSANRGFGAPVKIDYEQTPENLAFLMSYDSDSFNRYEAGQTFGRDVLLKLLQDYQNGKELVVPNEFINAYGAVLKDKNLGPSFKALALTLPTEGILHQVQNPIDVEGTHAVRLHLLKTIAGAYEHDFEEIYESLNHFGEYKLDGVSIGNRSLKNLCLSYLSVLGTYDNFAYEQFKSATNMTEEIHALSVIVKSQSDHENAYKNDAIKSFYDKWKGETLVMQKWLAVQAGSPLDEAFDIVKELKKSPVYDITIPNLVRSLIGAFAFNDVQFHHKSGRGYKFIAEEIKVIDKLNPQMASRLVSAFKNYRRMPEAKQQLMKEELLAIKNTGGLSKNSYEIVSKILD